MRILQVIHDFIPEVRAGSELCTYYLSAELKARGHEVLVFYPTWGLKEITRKTVDGVDCFTFPNTSNPLGMFIGHNSEVDEMFTRVLKDFKPDIVHIQNLLYLSLNIVEIAKQHGVKVVFTLHDYWLLCPRTILLAYDGQNCTGINHIKCVECCKRIMPLDAVKQFQRTSPARYGWLNNVWIERVRRNVLAYRFLKHERAAFVEQNIFDIVDVFISPSQFLRNKFIENGLSERKLIFLDNGTKGEIFQNIRRKTQGKLRFGFIGSILPHKGIDVLLEAFNGITDAELKIYGKLSEVNAHFLKRVANPRITFMGEVNDDQKAQAFEEMDVLIVPSVWFENSPVTIHEAILAGVPIIASAIGGMPEYVNTMENGLLFTPGDPDDLATKIRYLIDNPSEVRRMSGNQPKVLSVPQHAELIEQLYEKLLSLKDSSSIDFSNFVNLAQFGYQRNGAVEHATNKLAFLVNTTWRTLLDAWQGTKPQRTYASSSFRGIRKSETPRGKQLDIVFGDKVMLVAFDTVLHEDGTLELYYTWRLLGDIIDTDKVFVHFCDAKSILLGQDHFFFDGQFPLTKWRVGQDFEESFKIKLMTRNEIPRQVIIKAGLYNTKSGNRFKIGTSTNARLDDDNTRAEIDHLPLQQQRNPRRDSVVDVSIVIPTRNAGNQFRKTLNQILLQKTERSYEIVVVDSGSTDDTLSLCTEYGARIIRIDRDDFNHGLTRNLGIYNAKGKYVVLMVQDAVPADDQWLENIVKHFDDEKVAGIFCRQIPRDDADVLTKRGLNAWLTARTQYDMKVITDRKDYERLSPMEKYFFCIFDDVCSCIRKSVWEQFPFPKTEFAEDLYFSKSVLEAGYKIIYEPGAAVIHSHSRSPMYEYKRTYIGHRKLFDLFRLQTVPDVQHVVNFSMKNLANDYAYLFKHEHNFQRKLRMAVKLPLFSFLSVYAQYRGARDEKQKERSVSMKGV